MARGHVTIDGKAYLLQDESYSSKPVPMFRPQLQVEGISHEALDQYLYMVQGTWDKGTNERQERDGWSGGTWRTMVGLDSSEAGKLKLQRATEASLLSAGVPNADATDDFNRADNDSLGANWDDPGGADIKIVSNQLITGAALSGSQVRYTGATFANDQSSEATLVTKAVGFGIIAGIGVRQTEGAPTDTFNGYFAVVNTNAGFLYLRKCVNQTLGGDSTLLGTAALPADGAVVKIGAVGSTITVYVAGIAVITVIDTAITAGNPGFARTNNVTAQFHVWDNWVGGGVTGSTPLGTGRVILISVGGFLYAFTADGDVFRTSNGTTWTVVTYDDATYGAVTAIDLYVVTGKSGVGDYAQGTLKFFAGTVTGRVWHATVGATLTPTQVANKGVEITLVKSYRGHVGVGFSNSFEMWPFTPGAVGAFNPQPKYSMGVPGNPVAAAVWNGVLMVLMQVNQRGSVISVADLTQISDSYEIHGEFVGQSMATWGSELVYAGFRPTVQGEIYTFQENLSDLIPKTGAVPYGVAALAPSAHYIVAAHNGEAGLWWIDKAGGGPLCGAVAPGAESTRIVDSIEYFLGQPYFNLRNTGIMRMSSTVYRTSGTMDTGWFTGGFPELTKEWAEVMVRLDAALVTGQTVVLSGRIDADTAFTSIGSLTVGDTYRVLTVPIALRRAKRLEIRCAMTGLGTSTPTVTAIVSRYLPRPVPMRVWGFTIKAFKGMTLLDGSKEHRTPEQIIDDLYGLMLTGQVSFASVLEPTARNVYAINVQMQAQLLGKTQADSVRAQEEAHVAVELLEALTSDFAT